MKIKRLIAFALSIVICFLAFIPAYAYIPEAPTLYNVTIEAGSGKIMTNNEDSVRSQYNPLYPEYQNHWLLASPSDFEELDHIELQVGEFETIKDRINYSAEGNDADWYVWNNEAFVTSTRVVNAILKSGLNTLRNGNGGAFAGYFYPKWCLKAYLFVPSSDELVFSHFEDQDGNVFDISTPVTKNLVLTPVFTTNSSADTFFGKEIHSVTFLPGEGTITKRYDYTYYYHKTDDCNEISITVLDGDKTLDNINKAYALQKYSDIEVASEFLYKSAELVLDEINSNNPSQAIDTFFDVYMRGIEEHYFTEPLFAGYVGGLVDDEGNQLYGTRNNSVSLAFIYTTWMEEFGEGNTSAEKLQDTIEKARNYESQTEEEKAATIKQMKDVLSAFSDAWENYLKSEYANLDDRICLFTKTAAGVVPIYNNSGEDNPDPEWVFVPPSIEYTFSHFEDQDGNKFVVGEDAVTKDLILTPIYYGRFDPRIETNIKSKIFIDTEDNSNESFNVLITREHNAALEKEAFDKGDYPGSELEYLNDKSSYTFNENDWEITEDGIITKYTGSLVQMLGIPETINGITVTGVATKAFEGLYERSIENNIIQYSSDYYYHFVAVWIPKTIDRFSDGLYGSDTIAEYKNQVLEQIRQELTQQNKTEKEIQNCVAYYENALDITIGSSGTNNCTPLAYLPPAYVVVENGNSSYSSQGGSLYDKEKKTLLYLSINAAASSEYYRNYGGDVFWGLEIPRSVTSISAFATYNAIEQRSGYTPLHAYGQTSFDVFSAYIKISTSDPATNYLDALCMEKYGKTYTEIQQTISSFYDRQPIVTDSFVEYQDRAYSDAQEAGLVDENGESIVPVPELAAFVLPYYMEWLDNYPEYHLTDLGLMVSMYNEGIMDVETDEYLISDAEAFEWRKSYVERYSDGAITLNINGTLVPNLSDEELSQAERLSASYLDAICMEKYGKTYAEIQQMITDFDNPPDELRQAFEERMEIMLSEAQAAGLVDDEGEIIGSPDELSNFVLPYFQEFINDYSEYSFTAMLLEFSAYCEHIVDPVTDELIVSEEEQLAWIKDYVETHSSLAVTLNSDGTLKPNLSDEELSQAERLSVSQLYNVEESQELLTVSSAILSFVLITNQTNVDAAKEPFEKWVKLTYPDTTQSEMDSYWEYFYGFVRCNTECDGFINRCGSASEGSPMETAFTPYDNYTYSVSLADVPERYIKPEQIEIEPNNEAKRNGSFYLKLKRGMVDIVTLDVDDATISLVAEYEIYSVTSDEIISNITTDSESLLAVLNDLTYGEYVVTQKAVSNEGYLINIESQSFSILEDGDQIHLTFYNKYNPTIYSVKIPKTIVLNGATGTAECKISVMGVLQSTQKITVEPIVNSFAMNELFASVDKKSAITATVNLQKREWLAADLQPDLWATTQFNISAPLTAGIWYGVLAIRISIGDI